MTDDNSKQHNQSIDPAQELKIELQEQINCEMAAKITRTLAKQKKIRQIEEQIEVRARQKNKQILSKLQKSVELKKKQLEDVKKKWHQRLEYQRQKTKAYYKNEKKKMAEAWKQSKRYITEGSLPKTNRQLASHRSILTQSRNHHSVQSRIPSIHNEETLRGYQFRLPYIEAQKPSFDPKERSRLKLQSCRAISKTYIANDEIPAQKIDKMASKLSKIESTRKKRQKIYDEKKKRMLAKIELMEIRKQENEENRPKKDKYAHKRSKTVEIEERGHLTEKTNMNKKRQLFKKWEEENRVRNERLLENRLNRGEDYLKSMQERKRKTKLVRELEEQSIQKKLYIQRIELAKLDK